MTDLAVKNYTGYYLPEGRCTDGFMSPSISLIRHEWKKQVHDRIAEFCLDKGGHYSSSRGGGLYVAQYVDLTVVNGVDFTLNKVGGTGGGIHSESPLTLGASNVSQNTAAVRGGGIYISYSAGMFNDTEISDNISGLDGGGIDTLGTGVSLTFTGSYKLKGNKAKRDGGGLNLITGLTADFGPAGEVMNNTAGYGGTTGDGGGIWVSYANLDKVSVANGATFSGNTAKRYAKTIAPEDLTTYNAKIAVPNSSWSERPDTSASFTRGYNNYDIAYTKTIVAEPPLFEKTTLSKFSKVGDAVVFQIRFKPPVDRTNYKGLLIYDKLPDSLIYKAAGSSAVLKHEDGTEDFATINGTDGTKGEAVTVYLPEVDLGLISDSDEFVITIAAEVSGDWDGSSDIENTVGYYPQTGSTQPDPTTDDPLVTESATADYVVSITDFDKSADVGYFTGVGDEVGYTISFDLPDDISTIDAIRIEDVLPTGLAYKANSLAVDIGGSAISLDPGRITNDSTNGHVGYKINAAELDGHGGDTVTLTLKATVTAAWSSGTLTNTANAYITPSGESEDTNPAGADGATITPTEPITSFAKTAAEHFGAFSNVGDLVKFDITFDLPDDPSGYDGVFVYDELPTGLTYWNAASALVVSQGGSGTPLTMSQYVNLIPAAGVRGDILKLQFDSDDMETYAGGSVTFTVAAKVNTSWNGANEILNSATMFVDIAGKATPDPDVDTPLYLAIGAVELREAPANFEKTATSGSTFTGAGDDITYSISLDLPTDLTGYEVGIIVYDPLPSALTLTSATASVMHGTATDITAKLSNDNTPEASSVKLTLSGTELTTYAGETVTITVNAKVNSSWTSGSISNVAEWYPVPDGSNPPDPTDPGTDPGGETDPEVITPPIVPPAPTSVNYTIHHYRVDSSGKIVATVTETKTGTIGSTVTAAAKTYVGYTFNANHAGTVRSGIVLANGSLVLKLYYEVKTFTVTFRDYNNKTIKKQLVEYGKNATAPPNPTRKGYIFDGWDKAKSAWQNVKSNVVVTATYKAASTPSKSTMFTVTFRDYNGRVISKQTVEEGKSATRPANPTRSGYTFAGWDKASSAWQSVRANIVVTATYRANTPPNPPNPPITTNPVDTGGGGGTGTTVIVNQPAGPVEPTPAETTPNDGVTESPEYDDTTVITPGDGIIEGTETGDGTGTDSTIEDGRTPLASSDTKGTDSWSLFDLICTIIAVVVALTATIIFVRREREEEDDESRNRRPVFLLLALLLAVVAIVLFVLTQNTKLPMSIFDKWSIIFAICALVGILSSWLTFGRKRETQTN